jgi:hypothetical protein
MHQRILAAALYAGLFFGNGAYASPKLLENIPLQWSPTSTLGEMGPLDISGPLLSRKVHVDAFQDARQKPALIAENHEKETNVLPVTTGDDVGAFVTRHLTKLMQKAGLPIAEGPVDAPGAREKCAGQGTLERDHRGRRTAFRPLVQSRELLRSDLRHADQGGLQPHE